MHTPTSLRRLKARLQVEVLEARNMLSISNALVNNSAEDPSGTGANLTQSETTSVIANDGSIIVGFNDSEENLVSGGHFTGWSRSTDGGATFTDGDVLPTTTAGDAGDPSMAINKATGAIYFTTLSLNVSNAIQLFRSTDNGQTFQFVSNAGPGFGATHTLDKEWMAIDNFGAPSQGSIYVTFTDFPLFGSAAIYFDRSTNGGATWSKTKLASGTVQGSNVVVGADHSVYVSWLDGNAASERILFRKGTRSGFAQARTIATLSTTGVNGDLGLDFRSNAFPQAATNPTNPNNIYVVYNDKGQTAGDRGDIFFTQSSNGGLTWSSPVKLNDDATTADQFTPAIAVTPDGSHLFVTWYDRREAASQNGDIERWGTIASISGSTVSFGANFRIDNAFDSTTMNNGFPETFGHDAVVNPSYMGDYDTALADNNNFYTNWGDNRLPSAPDVFFASIPVTGPTAASRVPWLVVHGSPAAAAGDAFVFGDSIANGTGAGTPAAAVAGTPSFANLSRFVLPPTGTSGGTINAVVTKNTGTVAGDSAVGTTSDGSQDQFLGYHHATKPVGSGLGEL
jgi:hypothetical protein